MGCAIFTIKMDDKSPSTWTSRYNVQSICISTVHDGKYDTTVKREIRDLINSGTTKKCDFILEIIFLKMKKNDHKNVWFWC